MLPLRRVSRGLNLLCVSLGYHWPGKQVVINMAPADIRKEGSSYDLPLAMGILTADEKVIKDEIESLCTYGRTLS